MTRSDRKRISLEIMPNDFHNLTMYSYLERVQGKGVRNEIFKACDMCYYPLALIEAGARAVDIRNSAIEAINHLHCQIQVILDRLESEGIQSTSGMLSKARVTEYIAESNTPMASQISPSFKSSTDEDDDWDIPPLSEAELALVRESEDELGGRFNNG
jgi:hypothetical protein